MSSGLSNVNIFLKLINSKQIYCCCCRLLLFVDTNLKSSTFTELTYEKLPKKTKNQKKKRQLWAIYVVLYKLKPVLIFIFSNMKTRSMWSLSQINNRHSNVKHTHPEPTILTYIVAVPC